MPRLASWNVNGIRACHKNGFLTWLQSANMDVVGLQEVRAERDQIPAELADLPGWEKHWYPCARKKGYSGVGILSRLPVKGLRTGIGIPEFDEEGRIILAEFDAFQFASIYFPNSGDGAVRLDYKIRFCKALHEWLEGVRKEGKPVIVSGDYNIAHQPIDLARPKENENTAGYLAEERAWMSEFLGSGWTDTYRYQNPAKEAAYSWWSMRMRARERNVGWRIDYHCLPSEFRDIVTATDIHPQIQGSDHCPVSVDIRV